MEESQGMSRPTQQPPMKPLATWKRYWLFQLPGIVLVAALTAVAAHWLSLPLWTCGIATVLWVAKDAALYPMLKYSYRAGGPVGPASLIGSVGTVRDTLDPTGLVKIGPELWKAKSSSPAAVGEIVRVVGCSGMTLLVEAPGPESDG